MAVLRQANAQPAAARAVLASSQLPASFAAHPWVQALRLELGEAGNAAPPFSAPAAYPELAHVQTQAVLQLKNAVSAASALLAAEAALKVQLVATPHSDLAWTDLAALYTATARPAQAAYAQAERMAAQGAWASSLSFLGQAIQTASRAGQLDLQAAWVQRELVIKGLLADERAFEQKQK
jgi:hypothetical protein